MFFFSSFSQGWGRREARWRLGLVEESEAFVLERRREKSACLEAEANHSDLGHLRQGRKNGRRQLPRSRKATPRALTQVEKRAAIVVAIIENGDAPEFGPGSGSGSGSGPCDVVFVVLIF